MENQEKKEDISNQPPNPIPSKEKKEGEPFFGFATIWNAVEEIQRMETKPRDHINASDIGGSFLDRWFKMKGTQPSNPYDARTLRVFAAGEIFEKLVVEVLAKAGILIDVQGWVEIPATSTNLLIKGKYDAKIGNVKDWNEVKELYKKRVEIEQEIYERVRNEMITKYQIEALPFLYFYSEFTDFLKYQGKKILDGLAKKFPTGLPFPIIVEVKSVNSNAFWSKKDYIGVGYPHHRLQLFTYLKGTGIEKGVLLYISKDDMTLEECIVFQGMKAIEDEWKNDIDKMSYHWLNQVKPEPEPDIIFNEEKGKAGLWEVNWKPARSPYLTLITGLKPDEWQKMAKELSKVKNKELVKNRRIKK